MPRLLLSVELLEDGHTLPGFPFVRQLNEKDTQAFVRYQKNTPGEFKTTPNTRLLDVHGFVATADQETCWLFNGQTDGLIPVAADGIIVLWDVVLDDGEETNVRVMRPGDPPAQILGLAAGDGAEDTAPPASDPGGFGEAGAGEGGFGT